MAGAVAPEASLLLEREREVGRLAELIAGATRGAGAAVLVEGPAGIGKTTLLARATGLARDAGHEVLSARGGELERDFAYGLARQLLEPPLARATAAQRTGLLDGAAGLAAAVLGLPGQADAARPGGIAGDDPAAAALHGLYWLTANLAAGGPLTLVVDDVHWGDGASLRFLAYLARRASELPVLVLAAGRAPAESHSPRLLEALGADPAVLRIEPGPLSAGAVAELVRRRLGEVDLRVAGDIHAATGGNPFLAQALVDALGEAGAEPVDRLLERGARGVTRFVSRRLARLGEDAVALARAVAVLGTEVEPRHAYLIAELDEEAGTRAEDVLIGAGVLAARRPLEFVHPLVRAAVAEQLTPPERARLHLAAARLLSEEGAPPERTAPHLLGVHARGDPWVVQVLRAAAARAAGRGAPEAAVRYLRRAEDEPAPPEVRPALLAELGKAEVRAGLPDDAVEHLRAALATAGSARERAHMTHDLAIGLVAPGRYAEAVAMLEEALGAAREADPEIARRLEAELLCAAKLDPRTQAIADGVYRGLPPDLPDGTPGARMLLAVVAHERGLRGGTAADAGALAARALDGGLVAEQSGDSGPVMDAGMALVLAGDFERLERGWAEAIADVQRRGSVIGFARCSVMRAIGRLAQGRLSEAEGDARNAITAAWEPGYRVARMAHGPLVEILVAQGELDEAERVLAAGELDGEIPDTFMLNFGLVARARLRLAQGRRAQAAADLEELGRREEGRRGLNPAFFPYRSLLALALADERPRALTLAREELELARAWGAAGAIGRSLRVLGVLTGGPDGLALLERSRAELEGSPWALERAETLVDLGAALRRAGERRACRAPLEEGMEQAHVCGARALVTRAREELLATGARPRRVMRTGVDALTASERRVAEMAASGMSNRAIAQALFVTVRTVEVHLTHAYAKLDISARDELPRVLSA